MMPLPYGANERLAAMTVWTVPVRFVGLDLPKSPENTDQRVRNRRIRSQQARAAA
jgi:hypothetical protein